MKIFKFGGASVKDAEGVKNIASVLKTVGYENTLVIVSAMGKTTNAMELVIKNYFENRAELQSALQDVKKFHNQNKYYDSALFVPVLLFFQILIQKHLFENVYP